MSNEELLNQSGFVVRSFVGRTVVVPREYANVEAVTEHQQGITLHFRLPVNGKTHIDLKQENYKAFWWLGIYEEVVKQAVNDLNLVPKLKYKIHLVQAALQNWRPKPGEILIEKGLTKDEAAELLQGREVVSYIRDEKKLLRDVMKELNVTPIIPDAYSSPSPLEGECTPLLLCSRLKGEQEVTYAVIYKEEQ